MITRDNLKNVLEHLNFEKDKNKYSITINNQKKMQVDFDKERLIYPEELVIENDTISNFSQNENFFVFECVYRLLKTGYKAKDLPILEIEKTKLEFFALTYQQKTLIIKAPTNIEEQKKFLGYVINKSKTNKSGLNEIQGLLSDKENRNTKDKIAYAIKQSFQGIFHHHESFSQYVNYINTCGLLNFNNAEFNKTLNLNITQNAKHNEELIKIVLFMGLCQKTNVKDLQPLLQTIQQLEKTLNLKKFLKQMKYYPSLQHPNKCGKHIA